MTYEQIKQRVYDQLKLPETEVMRLGYATQIPRLLNAALFRIAHSILPNIREYIIELSRENLPARISMPPDFISFADEQVAYLNGKAFTLSNFISANEVILTGAEINDDTAVCKYHIFYNADYPRISDSALKWTKVQLQPARDMDAYTVVDISINEYSIPDNAAMAVPHYIAGQLLSLDDKVRSVEEMNEFEVLLSVIETSRHERVRDYHSSRGWY